MLIPLKKVYLDPQERLRVKHQNIKQLATSFIRRGQIQSIVVRPPRKEELPLPREADYVIEAGARRFLAMCLIQPLFADQEVRAEIHGGLTEGHISADIREGDSELMSLEVEFHENEDRDNFDWKEKASYVWRIHDGHVALDPEWHPHDTAILLEMGESTVYKYLEFRKNEKAFEDERVQEADTFRTAKKQFDIVKKLQEREMVVKHREKRQEAAIQEAQKDTEESEDAETISEAPILLPHHILAERIAQEGDCVEWIKKWPDKTFDFVHWDPPYGGEQRGGVFTSFKKIDDSWSYAMSLMETMIPEIWRTLKPGHWLVMWCHPANIHRISQLLSGHSRAINYETSEEYCRYCQRPWTNEKLQQHCPAAPFNFWVNPYPNHWYKANRMSDGHEIKRFLINAEEPFIFAAKMGQITPEGEPPDPILVRNDRQNVFTFPMLPREERRHVMHKPRKLLAEILSCVSIPGEFGADFSYGSGSILEAALETGRKIVGCELEHENVLTTRAVLEDLIEELGLQAWEELL